MNNKMKEETTGKDASQQLMNLIQYDKWANEKYMTLYGMPSSGAKRQSLSGEFAAGSSLWMYRAKAFYERVEDLIKEINYKWNWKLETDTYKQPTNVVGDLDNAGESMEPDNQNAVKEEPETAKIREGVE
jgi:hypothetical protein